MRIKSSNSASILIIDLIKKNESDIFRLKNKGTSFNLLNEFSEKKEKKPRLSASIHSNNDGFIPPNIRIYGFKKIIKVSKSVIEQAKLIDFDSIIENINEKDLMIEPFIVMLENDKEGFISYSRTGNDITYLRWMNLDEYINSKDGNPKLVSNCFSFVNKAFFNDDIIDNNFAFKLLIYLTFGEISEKYIPTKEKRKIGNITTFTNDSNLNITYANSLWKTNIKVGEFSVRGHFRMQPYGVGRNERRLIWIDTFKKNGYNLKAGMNRNFND